MYSKLFKFTAIIVITSFLFCSCATLFHGSTDDVGFSSDPTGATVYVNGDLMGKTPLKLELKSNKTYSIEFRKDGYDKKTVLINNNVGAGWIILDIVFGLIPVVVDAATGDWNSLDQDHVRAALEKQQEQKNNDEKYEDVVYLKNGSIIHGTIIEQVTGESIKIKTNDGNTFVFKMDEIEKTTKEAIK